MSYTTEQKVLEPGGQVNINKESQTEAVPSGGMSALERLPHITKRVCLLWGHPEFDAFTSHLMMDSRDGKRQGLPWDVAEELLFLAELRVVKRAIVASGVTGQPFWEVFNQMLANAEAAAQRMQHEAWDDPQMTRDVSRALRPEGEHSRPPADLARTNTKDLARTNTKDLARTNTKDLARTNTKDLARTNTKDLARTNTKKAPAKKSWLTRLFD
jgi:hypothetical protein